MLFLFERFWYPLSQTAGTHEPQRTSWGRCSGRVQLFPKAKEQQMLVLWDRNPFFQPFHVRPTMDKPHSSRFWLAPPSIPSDLYSLFFVPPHLTLFSFLASLQLSVPPLCPCTGKTPQFSKHICCCQALPFAFSLLLNLLIPLLYSGCLHLPTANSPFQSFCPLYSTEIAVD